jgi:hypothetical protein
VGIGTQGAAYKLEVSGSFAATTKSFVIDHPTKPGKKLVYGVIEGPEHSVFIRGKTTTNIIELPEYWAKLIDENTLTVQLTPANAFQKLVVVSVSSNQIVIKNDNLINSSIDCYFFVQAERKDIPKLETEV